MSASRLRVPAEPAAWPVLGPANPAAVALVVIDMQMDFVRAGGWFHAFGVDLTEVEAVVPVIGGLLSAARGVPGLHVVHTRQGNAPDLSDLPPTKRAQGERSGNPIGRPGARGRGLIRGEPGWCFVPELAPLPGERIVEKPGFGAFADTDLHEWLRDRGITALALMGVTANVCVLSTLLSAVDLGYDCLVVRDAIAGVDRRTTEGVCDLIRYQGGLFGCLATAEVVTDALRALG